MNINFESTIGYEISKRGYEYYKNNLVSDVSKEEFGYSAKVMGSKVYDVSVKLAENIFLGGSCTCPYNETGDYCKHIAALLYYLNEHEIDPGLCRRWNKWLILPYGIGTYTNADQEAGDNSYHCAGASLNNYVSFGSDEEVCSNDNLYRIIGAFDDDNDKVYNVKLIKYDYVTSEMLGTNGRDYANNYSFYTTYYKCTMDTSTIAAYRWNYDTSISGSGSNNWITSEFNTINLNTNYWNYLGSDWQNLIATTNGI